MKTFGRLIILVIGFFLIVPEHTCSQPVDITALVKAKNPDVEREIERICEESCLGNESKGWLHSISYARIDNRTYHVQMEARFRNRHHVGPMYLFGAKIGEEGDLYNHTVIVRTKGKIDRKTCVAVVEDIWVENDFRGIFTALVEREIRRGKTTTLNGCAEYLR